jgi:hypothetical protein
MMVSFNIHHMKSVSSNLVWKTFDYITSVKPKLDLAEPLARTAVVATMCTSITSILH